MTSKAIQYGFFFTVFALIAVLGFFIFKPYLNALVLSATFAILFYPLYLRITAGFRDRWHGLASILTVIIAAIVVLVPLFFLGQQVLVQATSLYTALTERSQAELAPLGGIQLFENPLLGQIQERLEGALTSASLNFSGYLQSGFEWLLNNARGLFQGVASFGFSVFLWFLAFYYFLRDGEKLKKIFVAISPLSDRYDKEIVRRIVVSVKSVIGGSIIVAIIQGILAGVGLAIFGIPTPALWGLVAIIGALVPMVGTALVFIPAVAYLFLIGKMVPAIALLLWGVFIVGWVDNILRPILIERGIQIHPLVILLSVLGGISFWGPVGFLLGPIVVSLLSEFVKIYQEMVVDHRV